MKKISVLLFATLVSLCLFTACDTEKEEGYETPADLIGKWKFVEDQIIVRTSDKEADRVIDIDLEAKMETEYDLTSIEFTSIGTFFVNGKIAGTYVVKGNRMALSYATESLEVKFEIKDNNLSVSRSYLAYYEEEQRENLPIDKEVEIYEVTYTEYFKR